MGASNDDTKRFCRFIPHLSKKFGSTQFTHVL
jgi:hypothetical protein